MLQGLQVNRVDRQSDVWMHDRYLQYLRVRSLATRETLVLLILVAQMVVGIPDHLILGLHSFQSSDWIMIVILEVGLGLIEHIPEVVQSELLSVMFQIVDVVERWHVTVPAVEHVVELLRVTVDRKVLC